MRSDLDVGDVYAKCLELVMFTIFTSVFVMIFNRRWGDFDGGDLMEEFSLIFAIC
jgi:hypothetical protein